MDTKAALRIKQWHDRAEELRTLAEQFNHKDARNDLLSLANQWEAMAKREVARAAPKERK
jgi:hypothetical protein